MNKPDNLKELNLSELTIKLTNKQKAAEDLTNWLSRHENTEPEYKRVWEDRNVLNSEIHALQRELENRKKPFTKSLNQSFEL